MWKANEAIGISEAEVPVERRWKAWADACADVLKLDILGLDILQASDGAEWVLEVNSSSIGLSQLGRDEDLRHLVELVLSKLQPVAAKLEAKSRANNFRAAIRGRLDSIALSSSLDTIIEILAPLEQRLTRASDASAVPSSSSVLLLLKPKKRLVQCDTQLERQIVFVWLHFAKMSQKLPASASFLLANCEYALQEVHSLFTQKHDIANIIDLMIEIELLKRKD